MLLGTSVCSSNPSAYQQAAPVCIGSFPQNAWEAKPDISPACKKMLGSFINFDDSFDQIDPSGSQKERVLKALYVLLAYPAEWPRADQKIYNTVSAVGFFPIELLEIHQQNPEFSLNQVLFNYVVEAISSYRLSNDSTLALSAYYNPDRTLTLKLKLSFQSLGDAGLFVHEARHSRYGHDIFCPEYYPSSIECDLGTNKAQGYQFSYAWALLHGNDRNRLTPEETLYLGNLMLNRVLLINTSADSWNAFKKTISNMMSGNHISLSYEAVVKAENLDVTENSISSSSSSSED